MAQDDLNHQPNGVADDTLFLAVVLELLSLLGLVSRAFPLDFASPLWWLRLGDTAVNLAPMLLLAVIVLCFSSPNEAMDAAAALTIRRRTLALASRWALIFGLIVPLELLAFGWLVLDSSDQLNAQLSRASAQLGVLATRLERTASETEFQRLLSTSSPSLLSALSPGSLPQQKAQLKETLGLSLSRLQTNLSNQRTATLVNSTPGTLRVVIGAMIISVFLLTIRRHCL